MDTMQEIREIFDEVDQNEIITYDLSKKLSSKFALLANDFSFDYKKIAEELTGETKYKDIFLVICRDYAILLADNYKNNIYDGRNEIACKRSFDMRKYLGLTDNEIADIVMIAKRYDAGNSLISVAKNLSMEHRTLQQSFAKIAFYTLYTYGYNDLDDAIEYGAVDEEFWRMPLV